MKRANTTRAVAASKAQIESSDNKKKHNVFTYNFIALPLRIVYLYFICLFVCLMSEAQTTEQWFLDLPSYIAIWCTHIHTHNHKNLLMHCCLNWTRHFQDKAFHNKAKGILIIKNTEFSAPQNLP